MTRSEIATVLRAAYIHADYEEMVEVVVDHIKSILEALEGKKEMKQ